MLALAGPALSAPPSPTAIKTRHAPLHAHAILQAAANIHLLARAEPRAQREEHIAEHLPPEGDFGARQAAAGQVRHRPDREIIERHPEVVASVLW